METDGLFKVINKSISLCSKTTWQLVGNPTKIIRWSWVRRNWCRVGSQCNESEEEVGIRWVRLKYTMTGEVFGAAAKLQGSFLGQKHSRAPNYHSGGSPFGQGPLLVQNCSAGVLFRRPLNSPSFFFPVSSLRDFSLIRPPKRCKIKRIWNFSSMAILTIDEEWLNTLRGRQRMICN